MVLEKGYESKTLVLNKLKKNKNMPAHKIKIKKAELVPDKYGNNIKISMIGLYDEHGKWIRWVKLNEAILDILLKNEIEV